MKYREQRPVIAVMRVAQHPADEPHVGELGKPFPFPVAFIEHVLRFDIEPELGRCINAFSDRRVQTVQAIKQEDFILFEFHRLGGSAPALFKAVNRLLNRFPVEQTPQMLIEQLNVQRLRRFVVAVVNPIGRMLHQRPEIIIEVQHEKTQPLLSQPFRQFDGRRRLARRTRAAHPHHAQLVARIKAGHDFPGGLIQRSLVNRQRFVHQRFDLPALHDFIEPGHRIAAPFPVPCQRLLHLRFGKTVPDKLIRPNRALAQPVPAPSITRVGIRCVLKTVTSHRMKDLVLNRLDRRWKIRNPVVRIRIKADHDCFSQKLRDFVIRAVSLKNLMVNSGQEVLLKAADRFSRAQNRAADQRFIELHQRPIALLDLDDAVLNGHCAGMYSGS